MKRIVFAITIVSCMLLFSAIPASAENMNRNTNETSMNANNYRTNATTDDDGFDWGWLGLLGLLGLAGARNRAHDRDHKRA
ncbi:WGxxGxxG family protein [Paenibacillus sinopodophylli]|uniref:WGxxGxxG family protein n=1 Tax=Paenibacillus sinopodophylli TaxID=1837342 RepID=UPI00110CBCE2|nr:WGxxGxxG family protein [Paenibacillus sinopodophylli]